MERATSTTDQVSNRRRQFSRVARWSIISLIILGGLLTGLELRRWAFEETESIRFLPDITRGFTWGRKCLTEGYLDQYDIAGVQPANSRFWLDYAPLRLGVMNFWAWVNSHRYPGVTEYRNTYEFNKPVVLFNAAIELFNAIGIFLLARFWVLKSNPNARTKGVAQGLSAALFVWFNPAMILSGSCWITWDLWVVPFYVWAVWLACTGRWFVAGVAMGVGAMFKGQELFVAPIFILWPIFMGQPAAALRWVIGFVFAIAVIASPWLVTYVPANSTKRILDWPAVMWTIGLTIAFTAPALLTRAILTTMRRWTFLRWLGYSAAAGCAFALLSCIIAFHGSYAWAACSWGFGTYHWEWMVMGQTSNLPGLLSIRFGWRDVHDVVFNFGSHPITMKTFLFSIYSVLLVITCVGMAVHDRRGDRRFLIAIVTPWLLFFSIPAQIHERYLLYGAGVGAVLIAYSFGFALLDLFLALVTFIMTIHVMLNTGDPGALARGISPTFGESLQQFVRSTHPDIGWAVLIVTGIFFYMTMSFRPRRAWTEDEILSSTSGRPLRVAYYVDETNA